MLVGIHQLHYLPWLRYFDKIARSDVFIVLDDIQFNKSGWQNRNKIKAPAVPKAIEATEAIIKTHAAAFPEVLATSSEKKTGLDELRAAVVFAAS